MVDRASPTSKTIIDAELISDDDVVHASRPNERRERSVVRTASETARTVARSLEEIGANETAKRLRTAGDIGDAIERTSKSLKPAISALKELAKKLEEHGIIGSSSRGEALLRSRRRRDDRVEVKTSSKTSSKEPQR